MRNFVYTDKGKELLRDVFNEHEKYVIENNTQGIDEEVLNQHCKVYKLWCNFWWGHLFDKQGLCKRCGYIKKQTHTKSYVGLVENSLKSNVKPI